MMRYYIILACFALGAKSLSVSDILNSKINQSENALRMDQGGKKIDEDLSLIKPQNPYVKRQRRSILTRFINEIAATIERLQMKPVLAEGINDVGHFGKNIKNKLHETPKSANVMLSDNVGGSMIEVTPDVDLERIESLFPKRNFYPPFDQEELKKIKKDMEPLEELVKVAEERESKLIQFLKKHEKIQPNAINALVMRGPNHVKTRDHFEQQTTDDPELQAKLKAEFASITEVREKIDKLAEKFTKIPMFQPHNLNEEIMAVKGRISYILQTNNTWLRGKPHSVFVPYISWRSQS